MYAAVLAAKESAGFGRDKDNVVGCRVNGEGVGSSSLLNVWLEFRD
jgi:hypothetical protein